MSTPATRTITLEVCGLGTLALGVDLINIPSVSAAKWRPGEVVPSDLSATFRVHRSRRVCDMLLRQPWVTGQLGGAVARTDTLLIVQYEPALGVYIQPGVAVWVGAERMVVTDSEVADGALYLWVDRAQDGTVARTVSLPSASNVAARTRFPDLGTALSVGNPVSLSGLRAIYRLHREDGTTRVLLDGVIRSMRDSGDLLEISVATNLGEIGEQAWPSVALSAPMNEPDDPVAPLPLMPPVWEQVFNGMSTSESSSAAHPIGRVDVVPQTMVPNPYNPPSPPASPLLASPYLPLSIGEGDVWPQEGRDARRELAALPESQGVSTAMLAYQPRGGVGRWPVGAVEIVAYPLTDEIERRSFEAQIENPDTHVTDTRTLRYYVPTGSVDEYYALVRVEPVAQGDDDVNAVLGGAAEYGVNRSHTTGDGEYDRAGRANQIGPLYASFRYVGGSSLNSASFSAWKLRAPWVYRSRKTGVSAYDPTRRRWPKTDDYSMHLVYAKDLVTLLPTKTGSGLYHYEGQTTSAQFANGFCEIPSYVLAPAWAATVYGAIAQCMTQLGLDVASLDSAVTSLVTMYGGVQAWPLEQFEGRKVKDTFFKDMHYAHAVEWAWGQDGRLTPVCLSNAFPASTPVRIDERVLLDGDATVQFDFAFALRSVTIDAAETIDRLCLVASDDTDRGRRYSYRYAGKTTIVSDRWSSAQSGTDLSVGGTVFSGRHQEPTAQDNQGTHRDVAEWAWRRAVRNYGAPYPTVTLRVRERVAAYPGTFVRIDHPTMSGPGGVVGVEDLLAQVLERGDDVESGTAEIQLLLVGWPV